LIIFSEVVVESPETLFERVYDQVKGTPIHDLLVQCLQRLLRVQSFGKAGFNLWDLINSAIQAATMVPIKEASNRHLCFESMSKHLQQIESTKQGSGADPILNTKSQPDLASKPSLPDISDNKGSSKKDQKKEKESSKKREKEEEKEKKTKRVAQNKEFPKICRNSPKT